MDKHFFGQMLRVGCVGFGGGNALIPVLESAFGLDRSERDRSDFDRDILVANLTPGALPVEIASSMGRRAGGRLGMVFGSAAMALPGTVLALLCFWLLSDVQQELLGAVKTASVGISAFIICLLAEYVEKTHQTCRREGRGPMALVVTLGVCVLVWGKNLHKLLGVEGTPLLSVSALTVLLASFFALGFVGTRKNRGRMVVAAPLCLVYLLGHGKRGLFADTLLLHCVELVMTLLFLFGCATSLRRKEGRSVDWKGLAGDFACWGVVLALCAVPALMLSADALSLMGRGILSSLMSFGGGDAYLTIAESLFVDTGMIRSERFFGEVVTVVNILPGSILCKTLAGVGFYLGIEGSGSVVTGLLLSVLGFVCSVAASCCAFNLLFYFYDALTGFPAFEALGRWVRPIVSGLLVNVALSLLVQGRGLIDYIHINAALIVPLVLVLSAGNLLVRRKWGWNALLVIILDIFAAFAILYPAAILG